MKPFRFGVNVWGARSRAEWASKARRLEDLGYSTLTVPDHLGEFFSPMPSLISAASRRQGLHDAWAGQFLPAHRESLHRGMTLSRCSYP